MGDVDEHQELIHDYNSRMLLVCFYFGFQPVIALFMLGDWYQLKKDSGRQLMSRLTGKVLLVTLLIIFGSNVYYLYLHTLANVRGQNHMILALFFLLFVVYLICNQVKDLNVKISFVISYTGISLSLIMVVTEYFFEKPGELTYLFVTGLVVYVFGYILLCARLTAMWVCRKKYKPQ